MAAITRLDLSASELRAAAGKEKNGGAARRTLALALVLEGSDRTTAANPCGMDRRTLRDWVHRYNQDGLCGPAQPRAAHERSVGRILDGLGYRRLSVRPRHPEADEDAQEAF